MELNYKLISAEYLTGYIAKANIDREKVTLLLHEKSNFTIEDFEYYIIASSLYSSKIEGNTLDVNSFFRNREKQSSVKKKEVAEIEALMNAYSFASDNPLNNTNFLKSHAFLSKTILPAKERGVLRKVQIGVHDSETLRPVYLAVEPEFLAEEFSKLFDDISKLLSSELSIEEIFYYASVLHLWVALIHPFSDGNGRAARLIEKWFLASKLGKAAWSINSEKYYWDNRPLYYTNIALGYNYYAIHWERCLPFLLMLPSSINH